jgi:hypothetical protein
MVIFNIRTYPGEIGEIILKFKDVQAVAVGGT